jgi:hypothetical protein
MGTAVNMKSRTGTEAGEKQELEFEFESEETSTAPRERRSAATVTEPVSSVAVYREGIVG